MNFVRRQLDSVINHKTKRPRLCLSHGTIRSNRFLPRETVRHYLNSLAKGLEWHRWAME